MKRKTTTLIGIMLLLLLSFAFYRERHLIYFFRHATASDEKPICDESLWQYNSEPEEVREQCIKITGVVTAMKPEEDDGDENMRLKPDPNYVHLLNIRNIFEQWGELAVEAICENPPARKKALHACAGYKSNIVLPRVNDHVTVIGSYDRDKKHGWMEIHPVTKIEIIP